MCICSRENHSFLGYSGVGKLTLVNAIAGEEIMVVSKIRENDSKGRHTTTHRQLIELASGVIVIDTYDDKKDFFSGLSNFKRFFVDQKR